MARHIVLKCHLRYKYQIPHPRKINDHIKTLNIYRLLSVDWQKISKFPNIYSIRIFNMDYISKYFKTTILY